MLVHALNILQKEISLKKYGDETSKKYLNEIKERYNLWHEANTRLIGSTANSEQPKDSEIIHERVRLLNEYKDFIDQQIYAEHFDSRSNLHSSVLEEFIYYLFRDLVLDFGSQSLIGKSHSFKDIFFAPPNFTSMVSEPHARIERKDHDFVIGIRVKAALNCETTIPSENSPAINPIMEIHSFDIPAVVIECKTYLDKTMLEGSSTSAEQLKSRNPNAIYLVATEWIKLTRNVNLKKYKVDQIYVFRKQKNTDREFRYIPSYYKNPIYSDVVEHMFEFIRSHLTNDWQHGLEFGLNNGWLI